MNVESGSTHTTACAGFKSTAHIAVSLHYPDSGHGRPLCRGAVVGFLLHLLSVTAAAGFHPEIDLVSIPG